MRNCDGEKELLLWNYYDIPKFDNTDLFIHDDVVHRRTS